MLKTIYNWLTVNQVWHDLIVLVVSILLTPYITRFLATAKKLISIPPQRLNVWILKARISAEDATLQDLYRLRSDLPYLIVALAECMMYLFVSVSVMGCFTFIKLVKSLKLLPPIGFRNVFLRFYFDSDVFLQVYFFVLLVVCTVVVKRIKTIVTLVKYSRSRERRIRANIDSLKGRLLKWDRNYYYAPDDNPATEPPLR